MGLVGEVRGAPCRDTKHVKSRFDGGAVCLDLGGSTSLNKSSKNSFNRGASTLVVCFPSQRNYFVEKLYFVKSCFVEKAYLSTQKYPNLCLKIPKRQLPY